MTPNPTDASIGSLKATNSGADAVVGHVRPGLDLVGA